jgi:hypothetical protein
MRAKATEARSSDKSRPIRQAQKEPAPGNSSPDLVNDPLVGLTGRATDDASASAHAHAIQRLIASNPAEAGRTILGLQRHYGNRYVQRVLARQPTTPGDAAPLQRDELHTRDEEEEEETAARQRGQSGEMGRGAGTQFTIGAPGDKFEQEADSVAAAVTQSRPTQSPAPGRGLAQILHHIGASEDQESRVMGPSAVQKLEMPGRDSKRIRVFAAGGVQRGDRSVPASLGSQIQQAQGRGTRLPDSVRRTLEARMGYDFAGVRVKTDSQAANLCRTLGARAFTQGNDIWLGRGESVNNLRLMAHELTHVVQQGAAGRANADQLLGKQAGSSKVLDHLRAIQDEGSARGMAYRRDIQNFKRQNPGHKLQTLQRQILEMPEAKSIRQQDQARTRVVRIAACSGGGGTPTFPSISDITSDATVEAERAADWTAGESDYKERSGWVMWDSSSGTYSVVNKRTGTEDGVSPGTTPADSGTNYHVGHYHQHPQLRPGRNKALFPVGPSAADRSFGNARNSPGVVRDYTTRARTTVTNYTYGPNRRS